MRGVDERNIAMDIRNSVRRGNDMIANNDFKRPNDLFDKRLVARNLPNLIPVVSKRGGDMRNLVQEGRKKEQFKKAATLFMTHTNPIGAKVVTSMFG